MNMLSFKLFSGVRSSLDIRAENLHDKRGTLGLVKRFSKMFPLDKAIVTQNERRRCTSRIDDSSIKIIDNRREKYSIVVSALKEINENSIRTSLKSRKNSSRGSSSDYTHRRNNNHLLADVKCSSKAIKFNDDKSSCSSDQISNVTWSSTSSKVSINKNFIKSVRFSHKRSSIFFKVYNKQNLEPDVIKQKRKSKSLTNVSDFSKNLLRIHKKRKIKKQK